MQGFFSVFTNHHDTINKLKNKNYMIISIKAEKPFDKIQHSLMIKFSRKFMIKVPPERKSSST